MAVGRTEMRSRPAASRRDTDLPWANRVRRRQAALPGGFDVLALAPGLSLGVHSAGATVDPRNVIARPAA
jgi:hypothetical protein